MATAHAEQELQRRRERGRSAQAAFRKRQAKSIQDTKAENEALKEALGLIIRVARPGDRSELVLAIKQAAKASGIDVAHLDVPRLPTPEEAIAVPNSHHDNESPASETQSRALSRHPLSGSGRLTGAQASPSWHREGGAWSPRQLGCGLWFDPMRYIRIDSPPPDIVPFLGPNMYTFAGQLFWAVIEHAETGECSHVHRRTPPEELNNDPCFRRAMDHSSALRDVSYMFIRAMAKARLEYRKQGSISVQYASVADVESHTTMERMVRDDYVRSGKDINAWLRPEAVEQRVRALLGRDRVVLLEEAIRSADNTPVHKSLKAVIAALVDSSICFGDGPRFSARVVDLAVFRWLMAVGCQP